MVMTLQVEFDAMQPSEALDILVVLGGVEFKCLRMQAFKIWQVRGVMRRACTNQYLREL